MMNPIPFLCEWGKQVTTVGIFTGERWLFIAAGLVMLGFSIKVFIDEGREDARAKRILELERTLMALYSGEKIPIGVWQKVESKPSGE